MNPQTRSLLVQRVADSLAAIGPGSVFERFAVVLIEHMLGIELAQRGSSIGGSPIGGVLDATTADGRIAVEASILREYFAGSMNKPRRDIDHVLVLAPLAEDIYLLCSQRAPTGVIEAFTIEMAQRADMAGHRVHLMDSRAIAETIVDRLMLQDNAIDALSEHLPVLSDVRDDHPASLLAPSLTSLYVAHEAVDAELDRRIVTDHCVEVCGIGGIGKSQAAAACLARNKPRFDYSFWVSGRDIDSIGQLSAVQLRRGGAERNVSALLRRNRTFVVLDDADDALSADELARLCGRESRILVTRRSASPGAYSLPMMDEQDARELLGKELAIPPREEAFQAIWRSIGGHPLSLRLINSASRGGVSWDDLAGDCARVGRMADGGTPLAERILGRLRHLLGDELSVFVWAGQSHCDRAFLKSVIGPISLVTLEQFGLTAPESPSSVRIHDIVFTSLAVGEWLSPQRAAVIDGHLEAFIVKHIRDDGHGLQKIASQLRGKIARNVENGDRRPAFLYALAVIWTGSAVRVDLLPDPLQLAEELAHQSAATHEVAILVVVETIEARGRHIRQMAGSSAGREWASRNLPAYDLLTSMADLAPRQAAEIGHHRAKTLRILKRYDEAEEGFRTVVENFPLYDAKLQLVRMLTRRPEGQAEAKRHSLEIIAAYKRGEGVSASSFMALGDTLNGERTSWSGDIMDEHEELFLSEALYSAAAGVSQGYHSVASFVRALVWHAPERVEDLLLRLPEPTPLMLDDDQSRAGYAEIMFHAAMSGSEQSYLSRALEAYGALTSPDDYQKRKWGETLFKLGDLPAAEAMLEDVEDEEGRIWLAHNLSQVKLGLGKSDDALVLADEAVEGSTGANVKYRSSFLLQRIKVKLALGMDACGDIDEGCRHTANAGLLAEFAFLRQQWDTTATI
ncbi:hypothetical protein [Sphingomonas endolithica]|uniref:hypothetical protein n=1 Tax=Sphingomonas endolithica TaxID=2972485 RepID=UPI0021AEA626|nr:hypothetical protein [Sphingomonas sp. ZFBP2030]